MREFEFIGFVTMNDPVREEVASNIDFLKKSN